MGTLLGHAFPGLLFYFFGAWNIINVLRTLASGREFSHQFWYRSPCCKTSIPTEPFLKIFFCIVGILIEMGHSARWSIHDAEGNFTNLNDLQHATMYTAFILTGVVDIILSRGSKLSGLDGLAYFLAFASEGLMFYFHLHDREMVDTQVHILLVLACAFCAVTAGAARWKSSVPILSLSCGLCTMVHGTWFVHAGFILYPPGQTKPIIDLSSMEAVMYVTDMYVIHFIIHLTIILLCYFVVKVATPRNTSLSDRRHLIKHTDSDIEMYNTVRKQYSQRRFCAESD